MYKYYRKNNYNVMEYRFDSIIEFIDYIENTEVRSDIFKRLSSETGDYDFCKTRTLEEAKKFCMFGYHEDFEKLKELKYKLEKYIKLSRQKSKQSPKSPCFSFGPATAKPCLTKAFSNTKVCLPTLFCILYPQNKMKNCNDKRNHHSVYYHRASNSKHFCTQTINHTF